MTPYPELRHFDALIGSLLAKGNVLVDGGFLPTQAGWVCHFATPLDAEVVRAFVEADPHDVEYVEADDLVHCRHCWGAVIGIRA